MKPLSVEISPDGGSLGGVGAGEHVDLTCRVRGSRPPPVVRWTVSGREVQTDEPNVSAEKKSLEEWGKDREISSIFFI